MKNILITGGAGFIGSNLSEYLLKKKYHVMVLDDLSVGRKDYLNNKKIKFIKSDAFNINSITFKKKVDIVIHLAAKAEILITKKKEDTYQHSNISALQSVLNFSSRNKIKKFIFASSSSIYGNSKNMVKENQNSNPQHFYAYTKLIGEQMIKHYCTINNINYTIFRFFNIYGKHSDAVIGKFISQNLQNEKITIYGNGKQKRDFVHVDDLSDAIYKSIRNNKSKNKIYNLGSGNSISVIDIKNIISKTKNFVYLQKRNDDIEISKSNIKKIKKDLKWKPKVKIEIGIKNMIILDRKRLSKKKLPSIQAQKKLIREFNKKI